MKSAASAGDEVVTGRHRTKGEEEERGTMVMKNKSPFCSSGTSLPLIHMIWLLHSFSHSPPDVEQSGGIERGKVNSKKVDACH